jgi:hypothetical protein
MTGQIQVLAKILLKSLTVGLGPRMVLGSTIVNLVSISSTIVPLAFACRIRRVRP